MTGSLAIVGLGPGAAEMLTPQAAAALAGATDLVGYGPYVDRVPIRGGQVRHASDNREELDRARHALLLAASGRFVAVVSGGDAGVFGMASAVFEAMGREPQLQAVDPVVIPGVSAMFAAAASVGAPLGADFCAISLSDNLKPWETIVRRLRGAAEAGFVISLYNPLSRARPWQLGAAFEVLRGVLPGTAPVVFATAVSRTDERVEIVTLEDAEPGRADMRTLVMIGTEATRRVGRFIYSPRSAA